MSLQCDSMIGILKETASRISDNVCVCVVIVRSVSGKWKASKREAMFKRFLLSLLKKAEVTCLVLPTKEASVHQANQPQKLAAPEHRVLQGQPNQA